MTDGQPAPTRAESDECGNLARSRGKLRNRVTASDREHPDSALILSQRPPFACQISRRQCPVGSFQFFTGQRPRADCGKCHRGQRRVSRIVAQIVRELGLQYLLHRFPNFRATPGQRKPDGRARAIDA